MSVENIETVQDVIDSMSLKVEELKKMTSYLHQYIPEKDMNSLEKKLSEIEMKMELLVFESDSATILECKIDDTPSNCRKFIDGYIQSITRDIHYILGYVECLTSKTDK